MKRCICCSKSSIKNHLLTFQLSIAHQSNVPYKYRSLKDPTQILGELTGFHINILMSVFSKRWPRRSLLEKFRWPTKNTYVYYTRYTKWTGKKANEVTDLQAALVVHVFQSDRSLQTVNQETLLSFFFNVTVKVPLTERMLY